MPRLPITGEYPPDWKAISDATWASAGHRCIRCLHPYKKGEHGKGEWSPCDRNCTHQGPIAHERGGYLVPFETNETAGSIVRGGILTVVAQWRIGTVHHLDGNKANCVWWNLLALCQRCHLQIQGKVIPGQPFIFEHSEWFKVYAAGFYAWKYESRQITRIEAFADLGRLLDLERIA